MSDCCFDVLAVTMLHCVNSCVPLLISHRLSSVCKINHKKCELPISSTSVVDFPCTYFIALNDAMKLKLFVIVSLYKPCSLTA